jgi:transposase
MSVTLNAAQSRRKELITKGLTGLMTNRELSLELMLTVRQITDIKARYRQKGDAAFVHGNIGRAPCNKVPEAVEKKVIAILETEKDGEKIYGKVNYAHFRDILEENYNIPLSRSKVRDTLMEHGYKSPKRRRVKQKKKLHLMRPRKEHAGELVQADGSPFDWLGIGKLLTIHGFIDDATGVPLGLYMMPHECLHGYLEATRYMLTHYGIPEQLYPDRIGIFFVNNAKNKEEKKLTQYGRIMEELGVDMYPAYSPEAKGRIERFWETIQSRLPTEFRMRGIKTMEGANAFLPEFIEKYSRWFGRSPASPDSKFVRLSPDGLKKLDTLLVAREERVTDSAGVFSLLGYKFEAKTCVRQRVAVIMSIQDGIYALTKDGRRHELTLLEDGSATPYMPKVRKALIDEYFHKDAKAKYRGPYQKAG